MKDDLRRDGQIRLFDNLFAICQKRVSKELSYFNYVGPPSGVRVPRQLSITLLSSTELTFESSHVLPQKKVVDNWKSLLFSATGFKFLSS